MTSNREPTPQDRLVASRQAILRLMSARGEPYTSAREQPFLDNSSDTPAAEPGNSAWQTLQRAIRAWWHNHPAQLVLEVGKPVLDKYAEEKPLQLLGVSAVAGAAIVLLKPWRVLSVTSLALAAIKHSNVSGFLLSLVTTQPHSSTQKDPN